MPRMMPTAVIAAVAITATTAAQDAAYRDVDALLREARALADEHAHCSARTLGRSGQGRDIPLLVIAPPGADDRARPALLLVAGLDARHRVGPETALRVARRLLEDPPAALDAVTVYVVPLANPDGARQRERGPDHGHVGTLTPVDADRDGLVDEDPPVDLDGNGVITMMRRANPPLDDAPTHRPDPAAPRLLTGPDPAEGFGAVYSVFVEGVDADGDGKIAEDGPGSVDLDRNFMHEYPEHAVNAGAHPLSEPEARALAEFVVGRPNIVMAVTYGRHDTVVHVSDGKARDVSGRGPKDLHADDVTWAKSIAELHEETTGQKRAAKEGHDGSFHVWLSAHRGIPSVATTLWGRPDPPKKESEQRDEGDGAAADSTDEPTDDAAPPDGPRAEKKNGKDGDKPADEEAAAWLTWSDEQRDGAGFIEWAPFDHPTLGAVEIGGFVPGFRLNPPASELDAIAEKQTAFIGALLERRPMVRFVGPTVEALAEGVYEVRLGIVNDGRLPTMTAQARAARAMLPMVVRLDVPIESIVAGDRVERAWGIDGGGSRETFRWIVRARPGAPLAVDVYAPYLGEHRIEFDAQETRP